ncbi:hypothetical protein OIV19_21565 [Brucella sp. HL-2]|nr:DUF6682 family protein [Brucella sp. HL-2]MCV9910187.1 hypothetical protein [Brucella sp. HL-2]
MLSASKIMSRARILLTDEESTRWPLSELAEWINEAVKTILIAKPSASTDTRVIPLERGTKQHWPTDGERTPVMFMKAIRNILPDGRPGKALTPVDLIAMNAIEPNWHDERRPRKQADHYIYDEQNPDEFFIYPANDGSGKIEILLACIPPVITAKGDEYELDSYQQDIGLLETYEAPVLDYVIYRAQSKDATGGSAALASSHYTLFAQAIGIKTQVEADSSPNARRTA